MRTYVTGGNGFIGSHLVRQLLQRGDRVVCLARSPQSMRRLQDAGAQIVQGDITDRAALAGPMRGADVVYHLAGLYKFGPKYTPQMRAINVDGARNVLETAAELGVPRIIHTSTVGVFGNCNWRPRDESYRSKKQDMSSEYELTKWEAHFEVAVPLQARGAPVIITQPGIVTGPGDPSPHMTQVDFYLRRVPMGFGRDAGITWAHVDDVAEGHLLAAERGRPGQSYILCGPSLTWKELIESWEPLTGIPAPKIWAPNWMIKSSQSALGLLERAGLKLDLAAESFETLVDYSFWGTADKAKSELGWRPRSLDDVSRAVLYHEMKNRGMRIPDSSPAPG
jgi:nucleoside-diphosphate-sugar epimerase